MKTRERGKITTTTGYTVIRSIRCHIVSYVDANNYYFVEMMSVRPRKKRGWYQNEKFTALHPSFLSTFQRPHQISTKLFNFGYFNFIRHDNKMAAMNK